MSMHTAKSHQRLRYSHTQSKCEVIEADERFDLYPHLIVPLERFNGGSKRFVSGVLTTFFFCFCFFCFFCFVFFSVINVFTEGRANLNRECPMILDEGPYQPT